MREKPRSKPAARPVAAPKPPAELHPRNRHRGRYDFPALIAACAELKPFVAVNQYGDESIDFANPAAVKMLNRALLAKFYGVKNWDVPAGYLCPPIPGRADYIHNLADLLVESHRGKTPEVVRVLDIGCGANCVYPLIGSAEYEWEMVGSEVDAVALTNAQQIVDANPQLNIELRQQKIPGAIFLGIVQDGEFFDLTLCNPPFHASLAEATKGSQRKWKNLGKAPRGKAAATPAPVLNFGGQGGELWCEGGEEAFIQRMISESRQIGQRCLWFTSLVSKASSLPLLYRTLEKAGARDVRTIEMSQGQKQSRFLAWTFIPPALHERFSSVLSEFGR
ncbi:MULTISPECIES: 23S rRNA (adenine(1618)-N(6))-methyltransferase RlmF [Deefgea]|uniref:Ribosomal RNA large subunit methyltransferase F n=1 Tax=Deefgea chitinilytica TaxID=570276 RepID=A0ABS2CE44_9NEIS|nr:MULTISPECIES: 23S rRNA (adenine(1618)-N(6))-methyltransferase RlmF [Deefgea]MBM5572405.1 23S rRNA (adenine(1618)-N(6))-methyltransferase RlmF [Deefgea chitinilytica]MBM9889641.1 23S rRNA (adenine(1618)-N(6))-methyltransferase RlmF [Deefgea sp. CFH1-16]